MVRLGVMPHLCQLILRQLTRDSRADAQIALEESASSIDALDAPIAGHIGRGAVHVPNVSVRISQTEQPGGIVRRTRTNTSNGRYPY